MRVARVAVAAPELAPVIGIERPVIHAGRGGRVEDALGCQRNEPGAAEALVEDGVGQSDGLTVGLYELQLPSHTAPSRTAGTRHTRIGERFWRRSQDRAGFWEGLPGVCAPRYTTEYNPKPATWPSVPRRNRPARPAARGSDPGMRRCGSSPVRADRRR